MAYELPLVRIYQQLEDVSPTLASPDLPVCVIGRAYQVLTYTDNKTDILVEDYDRVSGNTFTPPSILPGGILDSTTVALYMDDMFIQIRTGTFNATINTATLVDNTVDFTTLNIDVGDTVVISHASLEDDLERVVIGIAEHTLSLNKNFTASLSSATYSVRKELNDRLIPSTKYTLDDNEVTVTAGMTHTYESISYTVISGTMYLQYRALRTDLTSDVDDVSSTAEIIEKIGTPSIDNPLALGVKLAKDNTTTSVKFIAVDTIEGDDLGWSNVKDILENKEDVYFLALLTDDSSIIGMFKTHCEQMSTADYHAWRVCSGGVPLVTEKVVIEEAATGTIFDSGGVLYFRDNDQEFRTDGVAAADRIEITSPSAVTGSYTINTVVNDNVLEVTTATPFPQAATNVTYTIERTLSKTAQAEEIADVIGAYASKRVIITWPDEIEVDDEVAEGYYLGCVIGGMVAGLPPHQGFTNLGIGSVDRIYHSNTYFNRTQLNTIAAAGGWIFIQDSPTALPYVRHQLTTDMQSVETKELNVVKNFDHLSYYFFNVLTPFIGQYNVTDQNVSLIEDAINIAAEAKTKAALPKIGAPLKSWTIVTMAESTTSSDKVEGKVQLDLPRPLNGIDLYLAI